MRPHHGLYDEARMDVSRVIDLGTLRYADAYAAQCTHVDELIAARAVRPEAARILVVQHPPVITVSRRPQAAAHLTATEGALRRAGVEVAETDRGGDITYHGPGQLVVYPIVDLNLHNLGIHDYMRLLEDAVIGACASFGLDTRRDASATGVWTVRDDKPFAKIAAMGVRVRRWVSMHGLALNVTTNLEHFRLIVPCGLHRPVTSLERELGPACPPMERVKAAVVGELAARLGAAAARACADRARAGSEDCVAG